MPQRRRSDKSQPFQSPPKIDATDFLRRCTLFKGLSDWELKAISKISRVVEFKREEVVYNAKEEGRALYIVVSGKFEAYTGTGAEKNVLAYLKQGSHFGEMSLVSKQPHSATVEARSDSLVLEISKEHFAKILQSNAAISIEISRVLSTRLKTENERIQMGRRNLLRSDVIGVYSIDQEIDQTAFSINLAASLTRETGELVILIDMSPSGRDISDQLKISSSLPEQYFQDLGEDLESILSNHLVRHASGIQILNLASKKPGTYSPEFMTHLINRLGVDFRYVVMDLPEQIDEACNAAILHSDHTFVVTGNDMQSVTEAQGIISNLDKRLTNTDEKVKVVIAEGMLGFAPTVQVQRELFGQKDCYCIPKQTAFNVPDADDSIRVIHAPDSDYAVIVRQIARKISNNLVGLALGSGAALGFSHIGVLKVMLREGIPVDYVSGSSIGALVACFHAMGKSPEEMTDLATKFGLWKIASLADISIIPWRGLIIGKNLKKFLNKYIQDMLIEDTKTPLIIVGANIHRRIPHIFDSGSMIDALSASIAIPGIFHPSTINGETVIDGGILDPLPVEPLLAKGVDKIIAVDVLPTPEDITDKQFFQDRLRQTREAMIAKKGPIQKGLYKIQKKMGSLLMPNSIDIVVTSMQAMEHVIAMSISQSADIVIRPRMPHISWVDFHRAGELIRKGEEAAEAALDDLKTLVKQQTL